MDYLSKASILLCCCFFLFADGQNAAKRFGRKGKDGASKSGHSDYLSEQYSSKSTQEIITLTKEKSTESQINAASDVQLQEHSLLNGISLPRRQGRRAFAFGSRLSGRTNNSSSTTIRPNVNGVKSKIRSSSTEKPASSDFFKSKENGSRPKTVNKLNSLAEEIKEKEQSNISSDIFKNEKEITASTEESSSYESGKATTGMVRRFTTKRGFTRQSKPGFVLSTIASVPIHPKSEILPTIASEKTSGENQQQGEKLSNNSSLPDTKSRTPFNHIKSRINQQRFNKLRPASNSELLKAESEASEILNNKNDEKVAEENPNDSISSSLQRRKITRFTKRPFNKLNSNLQSMFASKSTHGLSSDSIIEEQNISHVEDSFKSLNQDDSEASEKFNSKSDEGVSEEKTNEHASLILPTRKTTRLTKRPFNKLNSNLQNLPASKSSDEFSSDYINEDQNLSRLQSSSEKPSLFSQTESSEKATELSEKHKKEEPGKINEDSNTSFSSNRLKGIKFTRRPSIKLNRTREGTIAAKPIRRIYMTTEEPASIKKEEEPEKIIPIRAPQWSQTESLELDREISLHSENIEHTQVTPFLPNQKKGNKRRPSHKFNNNQQDSRITNSKRNTDISDEIIKNQQQFSNLKFDPIKPTQWSQAESLDSTRGDIVYSENNEDTQPATPFVSNRKRGSKRRPSHNLNSNQQVSRVTNPKTTTDISEDVIKSQQQFSNLQFDPIKPIQWPQVESMESYTGGIVDSENKEDTQPAAPFQSNWRKGNKRRPSHKLNSNQQDSRITNTKRNTDISEDVIKSQQQFSNLQFDPIKPMQWPQVESMESYKSGIVDSKNTEDTQKAAPFHSNWRKGNKRRPSHNLNRNQQDSRITNPKRTTDNSEDMIKSQQQYSNLQFDPIKPPQWPQAESQELNRDGSVDSENVEDTQPATPILSNRKKGNKRRPSHKLNSNQQDSRVTNPKRTTGISEDVIKSQQQYSNLQFDPIKSLQLSQKEPVGKSTEESIDIFGNRQETPFISNRHRGNKNTKRPSNQLNRPRQNPVRTNPAQQNPSVYGIPNLSRFEDTSEDVPFKPSREITNETPKGVTGKTDEFFRNREVIPFHSYRQRDSKNTRRPADKKSVPTTRSRTEITEKPHVLQANNYQDRFPYPNADLLDRFSPFRPSQFPVNIPPQRSNERDSPFEEIGRLKESKPRRRPSGKLNSDNQSGVEISVLNRKTDTTRFEKPEIALPSRDIAPFAPSQYNHQPYFYPSGYSINEKERFEIYPASLNRIAYNSRHTGRISGPLIEGGNSDLFQSYDRNQNMFTNFNNTKITPTSRRTTPSGKYIEVSTEGSGSPEIIYEPKEVFTISAEEHSPFITTHPLPSSKHSFSVNESNISKQTDANLVSNSAAETTPNYQQDFTLERIQTSLKPLPTSSPEERISESLYYQANYSSESELANHPNSNLLSHFRENTQTSSDYLAHELYYSNITERPTSSLETKYAFPSNSLSTETQLPTTLEPIKQQQGEIQVIKQAFNYSATNYDELPIATSTATNESVIFLPNVKQKSPSQAFTSVSVKYPSFSKNDQRELKNTLALSKPFISSPLSTIFDTSNENGQYYHYVMNLGQKHPTNKGIAKTKVYSSGNALYTILHEDEFNTQSIPNGYGTSALENAKESTDKAGSPEYIDQYQINNMKSIGSSKPNFESEGNVLNLIYNATILPTNSPNKTDNELSDANIASISHTLIQEANFTEIYPLVEVTTQPIQTELLSSNVNSELNSISSLLEGIFDNESINQTRQYESSTTPYFLADIFETVSETNESLNQSSFPEIPTASTFSIFGNYSFQNRSLNPNPFQGTETTQNYSETENALSYVTVTETSADVPSTFDYLGHLDKTILQRIYLLAKRNGSVSFGNVSYKLDLNKLLNILNENASVLQLTTESRPETTQAPLFYDGFPETSTFLPTTTENSRSHTPLYSENNIDIGNIAESINENSLPVSNLYIVGEGSDLENTTPITESTTSLPMINSSPTNNFQLSFDSSKIRTMDRVILPDLSDVIKSSNIVDDASKDLSSHPMLELVIKNSSVDDFISKINRVPVVIRVFNPISKSYHSVLITPESKSNEEMNFVDTDNHGNISHSDESLDNNSNKPDSEIIKEDVNLITDSDEISSDADQTSNTGVYFDTILPNESYTDNIPSITSNENDDDALTSVSPSQPERQLISIEELKELLMKSVEQSVNLPLYSTTLDEAESVHNIPDMDKEQGINDKFPMLAKQSRFPIEMNNISPEDISISISESVVINPEPESDTGAETQDIFKNDKVLPVKSEPREKEMNMSMLKNVDDPIKMVLSIMETYKSPKEATMWKDEASSIGESPMESPLHADSQITNKQSSDERKIDNDETPFIVSLQTESPMGFESLDTGNYQISKESSAKDGETPFVVPLKVESHGNINHPNDDKPLHLIPIYFKGDEYETPAESQRVYEFQQINGDLKRIYPHSKLYNNGLSRPSHLSGKADKVSHKADHVEFPFAESNTKTNHRDNAELSYAAKNRHVQDYGTYLQYSRIGSLHDRNVQSPMRKSHSQVTGGFPQQSIPSSSSDILPEDNDDSQMSSRKDTKEVDVKRSQNLNSDNFNQLQESGALPEIPVEGESNNYQEITDMIADDTVDVPVLEYGFRDVPQHSDRSTSTYTPFPKDNKNDYHTEISRTDRIKNSSEKNGKSYYRTLPQFISPEITTVDLIRDNRKISYQVSNDSTAQKKSSTSDIQKLNSKGLLEHTPTDTRLQKSSSNWDDTESTVKYVKAIPYVEPKRNKHAVTDSENSTSDQFILLEDTDATVDKPNNQPRRDALKTDDKMSDVMIKSVLPLNDDSDYLYPIFKTDRSKYGRSLSE